MKLPLKTTKLFMLKYVINIVFLLLCCTVLQAQEEKEIEQAQDSIQKKYGLRVGIDAASLARSFFDDNYQGFQILGDFRLTPSLYVAGELGNETIAKDLERIEYETSGSFFKAGIDYNFYNNWLEMDNMIYGGARIGVASFGHELYRYEYNSDNTLFPILSQQVQREYNGLTAIWFEVQGGMKVEVFNNIYLMANVQLKFLINESTPDDFDNLHIPGFGVTNDFNGIGVGYTYGILYRIPLFEK